MRRGWVVGGVAGALCVVVAAGLCVVALRHPGAWAGSTAGEFATPAAPVVGPPPIAPPGSTVAATTPAATASSLPSSPPAPSSAAPAPQAFDATVAFAGDVLLHTQIDAAARTSTGYDYTSVLAGISPWIGGADLAICQLEIPILPPGRPISGYPVFGAPHQIITGLAKTGWDGCSTATNHSLDQGTAGVQTTVDTLKAAGMGYSGMALSQADANDAQLYRLTQGGQTLTVAHISTAYGFNGFTLPKNAPWEVATNNVAQIVARAKAARAAGADIVLLSVHFGIEYQTKPNADQQTFIKQIAASGEIDAVIGGHPHVPEPMTKVGGGVGGQGMWVAYSLGNMISAQTGDIKDTGIVAYVHLTKDANGARVTGLTWSAVSVDSGYRLRMLEDAKPGQGIGHLSAAQVKERHDAVAAIVGTAVKEQMTPPKSSGATLEVLPK